MAISLKSILDSAENSGLNPDGSPFDQRSLGYGDNPPLILKDLPKVNEDTNGKLDLVNQVTDNFVRGGALGLGNAVIDDLKRLGKVLISPNGLAWSVAQIALAKTNPLGPILPKKGGFLQNIVGGPRNRQSLPISVLATAGTGAAGVRFRKDGLLDLKFESGYNYDKNRGGPKYESSLLERTTKSNAIKYKDAINSDEGVLDHTLLGTYFNVRGRQSDKSIIKEYSGGAHSLFGIGKTTIKRYKSTPYGLNAGNEVNPEGYLPLFNKDLFTLRQAGLDPSSLHKDYRSKDNTKAKSIPNNKTRINLYNVGDPGVKINNEDNYDVVDVRTIDKISAANIFKRLSPSETLDPNLRDYIKFKIAVVDTSNPITDNVILFRALLDNITDSFTGEWNSYKYNGRAEKFYTYSGFDRAINFGFKIHIQTRAEQKPLWRKLNYLVAQTAPEYKNRRMRGVFSRLTIGDWMNEIPGFFTSVNLGWNTAYPWEIRHDHLDKDKDLNEYPHILDVTCTFQPVHNFAPSNSPTTPFLLPEIGVENNRKYAQQQDSDLPLLDKNLIAGNMADSITTPQLLPTPSVATVAPVTTLEEATLPPIFTPQQQILLGNIF